MYRIEYESVIVDCAVVYPQKAKSPRALPTDRQKDKKDRQKFR